eukprot:scaffold3564_cov62-Cylindrotheca_fusiformis.AAC.1
MSSLIARSFYLFTSRRWNVPTTSCLGTLFRKKGFRHDSLSEAAACDRRSSAFVGTHCCWKVEHGRCCCFYYSSEIEVLTNQLRYFGSTTAAAAAAVAVPSTTFKRGPTGRERNHAVRFAVSSPIQKLENCQNVREISKLLRDEHHHPLAFYKANDFKKLVKTTMDIVLLQQQQTKKKKSNIDARIKPYEISGLMNALSKVSTQDDKMHRQVLFNLSQQLVIANNNNNNKRGGGLKNYRVKDISIILNALARRNVHNETFFQQAAAHILIKKNSTLMNPQDLANISNAYAKVNHHSSSSDLLFEAIAKASISQIQDFTPQGLANLVNAFAKMNHHHHRRENDDLLDAVSNETILRLSSSSSRSNSRNVSTSKKHETNPSLRQRSSSNFTAQGLANIVNAFAKMMNHHHSGTTTTKKLFETIATVAISNISTFNSQNLANTANAFAKMNHRHSELFQIIGDESITKLSTFNAQELSNLVNAFVNLQHDHPALFQEAEKVTFPLLSTFKAQELCILANAFAKTNHYHTSSSDRLWNGIATAAMPILPSFRLQELAILANAFAKARHYDRDLFQTIAKVAVHKISPSLESPSDLSILANAFARVDHDVLEKDLWIAISKAAIPRISHLAPQELANLVSAFARMRLDDETTSVDLLFSATAEYMMMDDDYDSSCRRLSLWDEQNLVEVAYAFLKAHKTNPDLLQKIAVELFHHRNDDDKVKLDAHGLGNMAAALSRQEIDASTVSLRCIFAEFQEVMMMEGRRQETVELRMVADICKALWLGQKLDILSPKFCQLLADHAIQKAHTASPADVRDILLNLGRPQLQPQQLLGKPKRKELFVAYKPMFQRYSCIKDIIAPKHAKTIRNHFLALDIDV